jgi:hypothetical protein
MIRTFAGSEDDLQYPHSVYNLNNVAADFSMEINAGKTKSMARIRMEPIASSIYNTDKTLELFVT